MIEFIIFNLQRVIMTLHDLAPILFVFTLIFYRKYLNVDFLAYGKFLAFLVLITLLRISIFTGATENLLPTSFLSELPLVFLEDVVVTLPFFYLRRFLTGKRALIWWVPISILFASGHIFYGWTWAFVTLFYPYFISYRYGVRYGLGTVFLCHYSYDMFTILTSYAVQFINLLPR